MLEKDGWILRYDGEEFVIQFSDRNLEARLYPDKGNKFDKYLIDMLSDNMPKHEVLIMDKLNGIVKRIEHLEKDLENRTIEKSRPLRPVQDL